MILLTLFILVQTSLYKMIGAKFGEDDYPKINSFVLSLLQVSRNTIGDLAPPSYEVW